MSQRPGYTATYDVIDKLDDYLPPGPAHRNAIIWRAVQAALDAEDAAGTEAVAELATELAEERTLVNQLRADLDHAERDNRRLNAENKRLRKTAQDAFRLGLRLTDEGGIFHPSFWETPEHHLRHMDTYTGGNTSTRKDQQ